MQKLKRITIHYIQTGSFVVDPTVLETTDRAGYGEVKAEDGQAVSSYRVFAGDRTVIVPIGNVQFIDVDLNAQA